MIKISVKYLIITVCLMLNLPVMADTIFVKPVPGDNTHQIQEAIHQAGKRNGAPVVIKFQNADYPLYRESSTEMLYHVSNTANIEDDPSSIKHIGLWMKNLKNITIDGGGALLVTHGKMTSIVMDGCENVVFRNLSITADDPTVVEMKVTKVGDDYMDVEPHASARYEIRNGKLAWLGHGWKLDAGIAQIFDPETNYTVRCSSPMSNLKNVEQLPGRSLRFHYNKKPPQCEPGQIFQMRDGIRDEVAIFILKSKNIAIENVKMHFLGNFGIVGQYSENITFDRMIFRPELGSGRTCAGFADFIQISGCKGLVKIVECQFEGAQDDPINVHGTHLEVQKYPAEKQIIVRFMHHQSYGFEAFFENDEIEMVDAQSLMCLQKVKVTKVHKLNDNEILLTINDAILPVVKAKTKVVVENVTWTPEVKITGCYFARIPSRGILVTTRRKVQIDGNVFFRTPMSAILIANDARSWYESGPAHDVVISNNQFIECEAPVIQIHPENAVNAGYVHKNIRIINNRFQLKDRNVIFGKSVSGLVIKNNLFISPVPGDQMDFVRTENCEHVTVSDNTVNEKMNKE